MSVALGSTTAIFTQIMQTCFVIQPFDGGKFDKRFKDVFCPAIKAANLEPYRVDEDKGVDVPIEAIEAGIKNSAVCFADITTDNPNVWYELGFAFASGRRVVMVCGDERTGKYPFDIQHRTITGYKSESSSDFTQLEKDITARLCASVKQTDRLQAIREHEQIAPVEGLSQMELAVIVALAGSVVLPTEGVSAYSAKNDTESAGFTAVAFNIGLQRLRAKKFVEVRDAEDFRGDANPHIYVTDNGWSWILENESLFMLRRTASAKDDIPF